MSFGSNFFYRVPLFSKLDPVSYLEGLGTAELILLSDYGITESGGVVTAWADQSSAGHDVSHATAGEQPDYVSPSPLAGRPSVYFDGDDRLNAATAADWTYIHDGSGSTSFCVIRPEIVDTGFFFDFCRGNTNNVGVYLAQQSYTIGFGISSGTGTWVVNTSSANVLTLASPSIVTLRLSSASYDIRVDGVSVISGSPGTLPSAAPYGPLCVGNLSRFGGLGFTGHEPAVVSYSDYLSDTDVALAERILADIYGISI